MRRALSTNQALSSSSSKPETVDYYTHSDAYLLAANALRNEKALPEPLSIVGSCLQPYIDCGLSKQIVWKSVRVRVKFVGASRMETPGPNPVRIDPTDLNRGTYSRIFCPLVLPQG